MPGSQDSELSALLDRLERSTSDAELQDALYDAEQLVHQWCVRERTGNPGILHESGARQELRAALVRLVDRDPRAGVAATIIWILGKLFDDSLEPYFARLAELYIDDDDLANHLFQTTIALDNLELIDTSNIRGLSATDLPVMRRMIRDYFVKRHG